MFKVSVKVLGLMAAAAATVGGSQANATTNLVKNGDFSAPGEGTGYAIGTVPDWNNLAEAGVETGNSALYGLPCVNGGCQNLEVNANTFGSVYQTVTGLVVGQVYDLSYLYGGRASGGLQLLTSTIGGVFLFDDSNSYGTWTTDSTYFTATATSEVLKFSTQTAVLGSAGGNKAEGNEITNVSITAVPEPATWAMMLLGFGMIGFAARARSRQNLKVTYA